MMALLSAIVWDHRTFGVVGAFSIPLAVIIGRVWYKMNRVRYECELKRSMVERGMSVQEIERVMAAGSKEA